MMVVLFVLTINSTGLRFSLMSTISSEAREARRLVWELGMFHGLWGTQADKLFPLYLESNTDTVLVWL